MVQSDPRMYKEGTKYVFRENDIKVTVHLERCFQFSVCNSVNTHPLPTNLYINGKLMKLSNAGERIV